MNSLTLADLFESVLADVDRVTTIPDPAAEVTSTVIWEAGSQADANPGSVVILAPDAGPPHGGPLADVLVRRAATLGAVLVILSPGAVPALSTKRLAERLGIAVAVATAGRGPLALAADLQLAVADRNVADANAIARIAEACLVSPPIEAIVALLGEVLDAEVAFVSSDGQVSSSLGPMAASSFSVSDAADLGVVRAIDIGGDVVHLVALRPGASARWRRLATRALAVAGGPLMAAEARVRLADERHRWTVERVMTEILQGADTLPPSSVEAADRLGIGLRGWHIGLEYQLTGAAPRRTVQEVVSAHVAGEGTLSPWLRVGGGALAWLTVPAAPTATSVRELTTRMRAAASEVARRWPGSRAVVGVGSAGYDVPGIARTAGQAHQAALVAVSDAGGDDVRVVHDLGASHLLLGWYGSGVFRDVADDILAPLLATGDHELVRTLAAYLDRACSASQTARALGLHRNTVNQRIVRAERILGVSFTAPDTRLALQLALRAQDLRG